MHFSKNQSVGQQRGVSISLGYIGKKKKSRVEPFFLFFVDDRCSPRPTSEQVGRAVQGALCAGSACTYSNCPLATFLNKYRVCGQHLWHIQNNIWNSSLSLLLLMAEGGVCLSPGGKTEKKERKNGPCAELVPERERNMHAQKRKKKSSLVWPGPQLEGYCTRRASFLPETSSMIFPFFFFLFPQPCAV